MRDSKDSSTVDLFTQAKRVGRPCTSSDAKRKQDAAERARRFRESRSGAISVRNTHEITLCEQTENDLLCIYNYARWASLSFDDDGNFIPCQNGFDPARDIQEVLKYVLAIAERSGVVWCNPPINRDLHKYRD